MENQWTYELKILTKSGDEESKSRLISVLRSLGESAFVEGYVDNLDIDPYGDVSVSDSYSELGGHSSALSLYRYDKGSLIELSGLLQSRIGGEVEIELKRMETSIWQEGWKESFRPIYTDNFVVHPPWEKPIVSDLVPLEIDPGMAFGTGQHETTQICLRILELQLLQRPNELYGCNLLDVGCGSGILGIAASKLGIGNVYARDIEADAVRATMQNSVRNSVDIDAEVGSFIISSSGQKRFDFVVANILGPVLESLFDGLLGALKPGGVLLLSGITTENERDFHGLAEQGGLSLQERVVMNSWVGLCFKVLPEI